MTRTSVIQHAYHVVETLRASPWGRTVAQLSSQLRADIRSTSLAFGWLRDLDAPIKTQERGRKHGRGRACRIHVLTDREWRVPFDSLDPQCKIWELERIIAPGAEVTLLDCTLCLQRENRALRERLIRLSRPCLNP